MNLATERERFEASKRIYESAKLKFAGVDGYDVYNPSIPFRWQGKTYMFGRGERRGEWARSWVRLFERSGGDEWTLVPDSMIYQLEDPYVSFIGDTLVFGGTHVRYESGKLKSFCAYFYRGTDLNDMYYFTTPARGAGRPFFVSRKAKICKFRPVQRRKGARPDRPRKS